MDNLNAMLINLAESRRNLACSMLAANGAGELPLTPDEIASYRAEIDECDAELAELRK